MRLLGCANNRGQLVIRSLIMLVIALTVCVVVYLVYKVTLVHLEIQNFTRQVGLVQKQVDQIQTNLNSSGNVSSVAELSRVLIILDEISSDVPSGPIKDQAESLKREVLALMNEMAGTKSLGTGMSEERDVRPQEPESTDRNIPIEPAGGQEGFNGNDETSEPSGPLDSFLEEYSVESE